MKRINILGWFFDIVFVALIILLFVTEDSIIAVFAALLLLKSYATNWDLNNAKKQLKEYCELTEILIKRFNTQDETHKKRSGRRCC